MRKPCFLILATSAILSFSWLRVSAETIPNGPSAFAPRVIKPMDAQALAKEIDVALEAGWKAAGVTPAAAADDAEFLRRVSLDIAGRIPSASEGRAFLESREPEKRRRLVDQLLAGPGFANHQTNLWLKLLMPEADGTFLISLFTDDFARWLRGQFARNASYDKMVRELLTVSVKDGNPFANRGQERDDKVSAFGFMAAKDGKPENLASSASRLFLGIRLECAQCHNHPFAQWKRDDFWQMAAFFSGINRIGGDGAIFQGTETPARRELLIPGTKKTVQASFLDGRDVEWEKASSTRAVFADWVTSPENPYFARAIANRVWSQYYGVGLADPIDDMGGTAEASHPALLDLLADQFIANGFDLKYLIRAITASRSYQLTSAGGSPSSDVYHYFDRMPVRGLMPSQLFDSIAMAAGTRPDTNFYVFNAMQNRVDRQDFADRFASLEDRPTDRQTSILQALTLMNGELVDNATALDRGPTLLAVADSYFLDATGRIETLYLATLSRLPRPDELERLVPYVERGGPTLNSRKALADVFWSLLSSAEFVFNH